MFPILLDKYQPTKLPQITILKIIGIIRPLRVKPLNNGFPKYELTTTQSQSEGSKPNKKPLSTVPKDPAINPWDKRRFI